MTTAPDLCSLAWDDVDVPVWGTAKSARVIVAVEVAGAWGRDPVKETGLRAPSGVTLYVMRAVGRHAQTPSHARVFVSGGFGDEPWIVDGSLTAAELSVFLDGPVDDPARWEDFGLARRDEPVLLVCTNGKRDTCCAVRARPVALAAHEVAPDNVWEVSHIGGHRFAPTAIHLPSGQTFGRLEDGGACAVASASAGAETLDSAAAQLFRSTTHRGRVDLHPAAQVAETWWRERHPELPLRPLGGLGEPVQVDGGWHVTLPDASTLEVTSVPGPTLRDSCIKAPKPSKHFEARVL